jgi:hypothetical protein
MLSPMRRRIVVRPPRTRLPVEQPVPDVKIFLLHLCRKSFSPCSPLHKLRGPGAAKNEYATLPSTGPVPANHPLSS